ncbi:disease resistance Aig2 [Pyrenophora seminiperda CCB06]|uniref:Putative gamma-glutamylcyclotransferase n=1 Tax=Pyrenophora seminiperda CCB06 TaxID=1302712 RepID=A0A3M7M153_9PLEO|nr:disease resistance Aig2 [Pyrenophora seminiperda CCB06]
MAPPVLHRVIYGTPTPPTPPTHPSPSLLLIRPALLPFHKRHKVLAADYPAIIPSPSSTVRGTLVTGLTDADIWRLDLFEGSEYERRRVGVRVLVAQGGRGGEEDGGDGGEGGGRGRDVYLGSG